MKIIFIGTPEICVPVFKSLISNHKISAVLTQPDKPSGRSKNLIPSPVATISQTENILTFKSDKIDNNLIEQLTNLHADIFITFAYGVIFPKNFLSITRFGGINIHPSLLPKYRGPSPIQTAILNGETHSGITIQTIKFKVDSGDILLQETFDIDANDNEISIEGKVSIKTPDMILKVLSDYEKNKINPIPQDETSATFCKMYKKDDGLIDWNTSGQEIINKIRAFIKWPHAFSFIDSKKVNIYNAKINNSLNKDLFFKEKNGKILFADKNNGIVVKVNNSLVNIDSLQIEGKKVLPWKDFINGYKDLNLKTFNNGDR